MATRGSYRLCLSAGRTELVVLQEPVKATAWQHLATTYVVCTEDRGTPAAAQREFARRASSVVELQTGHHPFLSQPERVVDLLLQR